MILTEGVHRLVYWLQADNTVGGVFARTAAHLPLRGQEVVEAVLIAAIVIEKEQTRWLNGKI